ncbi:multidrug efflux SMR transporter [Wohlfahrtiimonas chitiniclastica]|uniref:DMT family transporter n=1 Tax=Wohlfahrtiimonas chitiniclastica TaxID=400946 RepID=UPI0007B41F31|nr:multidrug efflux SMR transporter [Wohlfahrtiimonas chitiniclastica]KZS23432.1 QacE family quaternary ammonium compound efflux SMR transporter [Wohlfahrtiimonas chitiniclastica]MBS7838828.1 multidrug efflux SMR transporter [Wohlfahrtiimonas chitiniclastica]WHR55837.1 multidrug efflux SMR transporter [Wohlfahrtiimonas chitiniclastica]
MAEYVTGFIQFIESFNPWLMLVIAILFSTVGTICLKLSDGFKRKKPILGVVIGYSIFFVLINIIFKRLDVSIGYAVWSGLSTLMVSLSGVLIFREPLTGKKAFGLFLIILGVSGLSYLS